MARCWVAWDSQGLQVLAWRADPEAEHFCPECAELVFIKHCIEKVTHFSHYPNLAAAEPESMNDVLRTSLSRRRLF